MTPPKFRTKDVSHSHGMAITDSNLRCKDVNSDRGLSMSSRYSRSIGASVSNPTAVLEMLYCTQMAVHLNFGYEPSFGPVPLEDDARMSGTKRQNSFDRTFGFEKLEDLFSCVLKVVSVFHVYLYHIVTARMIWRNERWHKQ